MAEPDRSLGGLADQGERLRQRGIEDRIEYFAILLASLDVEQVDPLRLCRGKLYGVLRLYPRAQFLRLVAKLLVGELLILFFARQYLIRDQLVFLDIARIRVEKLLYKTKHIR